MPIEPFASIRAIKIGLEKKVFSSKELLSYYLERFSLYDTKLRSALEIYDQDSIENSSSCKGILSAIPGLIKANICQKGRITSCASKILANYRAMYDATAVVRLKESGALLLGSANCDEFAMGGSTEYSAYKKTANPWDLSRGPGGSSGGSAAAVAAGLVPWALGSDTGGSIRHPAAVCGIVGLKPTYGLVSRYGLVAYASSLDCIGPMTRTVYDNALVLSGIAGHDPYDATSCKISSQDYTQYLTGRIAAGLKIGVITNAYTSEIVKPEIYRALEEVLKIYKKLGAHITYITLPALKYASAVYFIISRAEAASNLARFDGVRYGYRSEHAQTLDALYAYTRSEGFGLEVKRRILAGTYILYQKEVEDIYYHAKKMRGAICYAFAQAFKEADLLFMPGSVDTAQPLGAYKSTLYDTTEEYITGAVNLAYLPAISVPCGFTCENLPIGFQLIGPRLAESLLYQVAYAYEQEMAWYKYYPQAFV